MSELPNPLNVQTFPLYKRLVLPHKQKKHVFQQDHFLSFVILLRIL